MSQKRKLAERIVKAREARGLSRAQAARRIAVGSRTLKNWEDGITTPRSNKLQMLAGVLGIPLLRLIEGGEEFESAALQPDRLASIERKLAQLTELQQQMQVVSLEIGREIADARRADRDIDRQAS